ncbi:MAG: leucine-rich repeat domain-containing protein [Alphaproteobacteria bacterium]|nr:leucine-rich repeat domain-containing protein [Alphaproteobacteria bacterium]
MKIQFIFLILLFYSLNVHAEVIASGNDCGENCSWSITDEGVLNVTGTGKIKDFPADGNGKAPWQEYKNMVTTINVGKGITFVGHYGFVYMREATSVSLPEGLVYIGIGAFEQMSKLQEINIPDSVGTIESFAFSRSSANMNSLIIPDSVTSLSNQAFINMSSKTEIYCSVSKKSLCEKALKNVGKDPSLLKTYEKTGGQYLYNNKFYSSLSDIGNGNYSKKRIYTIEEASRLSRSSGNTIKIKYK